MVPSTPPAAAAATADPTPPGPATGIDALLECPTELAAFLPDAARLNFASACKYYHKFPN